MKQLFVRSSMQANVLCMLRRMNYYPLGTNGMRKNVLRRNQKIEGTNIRTINVSSFNILLFYYNIHYKTNEELFISQPQKFFFFPNLFSYTNILFLKRIYLFLVPVSELCSQLNQKFSIAQTCKGQVGKMVQLAMLLKIHCRS